MMSTTTNDKDIESNPTKDVVNPISMELSSGGQKKEIKKAQPPPRKNTENEKNEESQRRRSGANNTSIMMMAKETLSAADTSNMDEHDKDKNLVGDDHNADIRLLSSLENGEQHTTSTERIQNTSRSSSRKQPSSSKRKSMKERSGNNTKSSKSSTTTTKQEDKIQKWRQKRGIESNRVIGLGHGALVQQTNKKNKAATHSTQHSTSATALEQSNTSVAAAGGGGGGGSKIMNRRSVITTTNSNYPNYPDNNMIDSNRSVTTNTNQLFANLIPDPGKLEYDEEKVRSEFGGGKLCTGFLQSTAASVLVLVRYLIQLETFISCSLTVGLTLYWYFTHKKTENWQGGGLNWVLLGFAVVTPITVSIGLAFRRREQALLHISRVRSCTFQIYLAHSIWDWKGSGGGGRNSTSGRAESGISWINHTDEVLEHLIGIGDELSRFLTLPTSSRSSHRMLSSGRKEAAKIVEVAYRLFDSLYTQRMGKISILAEKIKFLGLSPTEASRLRQYERFIGEAIEGLRMIKMYRTPQALRSFARIFTVVVPPFYAPSFANVAMELESLTMGILFAILIPLCLTALFESVQHIEDPFVGYVTLDGIDVREEFEVLHWHQLINARKLLFPHAPEFNLESRAALEGDTFHAKSPSSLDGSSRKSHFVMNEYIESGGRHFSASAHSNHTRSSRTTNRL